VEQQIPIRRNDWKSIKGIWQDFSCSEYAQYDIPHDTDDESVRARICKWTKFNNGTDHMFFAICLGEIVIGYIAFNISEAWCSCGVEQKKQSRIRLEFTRNLRNMPYVQD